MDIQKIDLLYKEIEELREEMKYAHIEYDIADDDLRDAIAYKIIYLQKKYVALSRRMGKAVGIAYNNQEKPKKVYKKILTFIKM